MGTLSFYFALSSVTAVACFTVPFLFSGGKGREYRAAKFVNLCLRGQIAEQGTKGAKWKKTSY